jgi:glycosyltransferase involved in cell wall biosynthesis
VPAIPIYNHAETIGPVLRSLALDLPCLVVDDGSDAGTRAALERPAVSRPGSRWNA